MVIIDQQYDYSILLSGREDERSREKESVRHCLHSATVSEQRMNESLTPLNRVKCAVYSVWG